jgi:hypothetical protein
VNLTALLPPPVSDGPPCFERNKILLSRDGALF